MKPLKLAHWFLLRYTVNSVNIPMDDILSPFILLEFWREALRGRQEKRKTQKFRRGKPRTCRKRWAASWGTCPRRAARWPGPCAPAPGRRKRMSGSWWCPGRSAAGCCSSACAARRCTRPRSGARDPLVGRETRWQKRGTRRKRFRSTGTVQRKENRCKKGQVSLSDALFELSKLSPFFPMLLKFGSE